VTKLLVLGRGGQLAQALARRAIGQFSRIECAGHTKADLARPGAIRSFIKDRRPDAVINAAAYTAVDKAETETVRALRINAQAAGEAAEAAHAIGARFVHVSTDYVFGGRAGAPFREDALPAPINAYGQTKLAGEGAVAAAHPGAAIVRTAAVFSGQGKDFPSAMWARAAEGQGLRVVADQYTSPTFADDLADRLVALTLAAEASGMFHAAGAPGVSWYEFARAAIDLMSIDIVINPIASIDLPRPAPRPTDSRLASTRLESLTGLPAPDWHKGLSSALDVWRSQR